MADMRAKMKVRQVVLMEGGAEQLVMSPISRSDSYPADGSDEDNTYAKFSPSGKLELTVTNPALYGKIKPGETYYVDFTKVEK